VPAIGVITLELRLDDAHSLKDKRHYVKPQGQVREVQRRRPKSIIRSCGSGR
jgi:uncharacterized protein YlxP (DUF503 family)